MSGNGRGNMRPTSKSPPFLVVGLLVAMCILAFNYWNLSSKNGELSQQFTRLQVDFRTVSDKHLTVEKRAGDLAAQLAELQARLNQLQHSVSEKDNRVTDLTGEVESYKSQLQKAQQTLQAAQGEVQRLQQEKNSVNGELEHLKEHLKETQDKHVSCDKSACREPIREVVGVLASAVDKTAIQTALNVHHPEVLSMVQDLVQGGNQVQGQQQPQNPVGGVPGENQQKADETGKLQQPQQPAQMVGQDPNVVQMQQGAAFPQQGGGDGVFPGQPQQQHEVVEQQKPQPVDTQDVLGVLKAKDSNVPEQKIVAQNIPQPGGDDANPVDPNNVNDLNVPAAQEDVADDRHMDLPEDEMDKQAAANHGAGGLENLDDNLHNQLQDLSKNDLAGEGHDEGDPLDDEEEKGEAAMDLNARDRLEERRAEEGDYDEAEQRQMEQPLQ